MNNSPALTVRMIEGWKQQGQEGRGSPEKRRWATTGKVCKPRKKV